MERKTTTEAAYNQTMAYSSCNHRTSYTWGLLILHLLVGGVAYTQDSVMHRWEAGQLDREVDTMRYLAHFPIGYERDTVSYPLILFLHGGGNSGDALQRVRESGLPREIDAGLDLPALVLAPQNRFKSGFWDHVALSQLLSEFVDTHRVDEDRIYLTGFSRGGYGAWMLAMHDRGRFAALVPVCGAAPFPYHVWIDKDLPIWAFHGADDDAIPLSESTRMLERLRQTMEVRPKFTVYEGVGHDAWGPAYADPRLYEWLLKQGRSSGDVE